MNKYRNQKVIVDGIKFDSIAESKRYKELKLLERQGIIKNLKLQPIFVLQPSFKKNNKTIRAITYKADFSYTVFYLENEKVRDKIIVEDVKGYATKEFKLKEKMFNYIYKEMELRIIKW